MPRVLSICVDEPECACMYRGAAPTLRELCQLVSCLVDVLADLSSLFGKPLPGCRGSHGLLGLLRCIAEEEARSEDRAGRADSSDLCGSLLLWGTIVLPKVFGGGPAAIAPCRVACTHPWAASLSRTESQVSINSLVRSRTLPSAAILPASPLSPDDRFSLPDDSVAVGATSKP